MTGSDALARFAERVYGRGTEEEWAVSVYCSEPSRRIVLALVEVAKAAQAWREIVYPIPAAEVSLDPDEQTRINNDIGFAELEILSKLDALDAALREQDND